MNIEKLQSQNIIEIENKKFEVDEKGFVSFGDVAELLLNAQDQYASRFVDGRLKEYPNLGKGLRFEGTTEDYHFLRIHKDDVREFVKRVRHQKGIKSEKLR